MKIRYLIVNVIIMTFVNSQFLSNNFRFLSIYNQDCITVILNCIQCSSNFTICHECKKGYKLSADQKQCNKTTKKNMMKLLLSIIIPIIVFALAIFIGMFIKIKRERAKSPSGKKNKRSKTYNKTVLSMISKLSKSSNSRKTADNQYTVTKYTDISTKSKFHPNTVESSINHLNNTQKTPILQSNFNINTQSVTIGVANSSSCNTNGPVVSERNVHYNQQPLCKSNFAKMPKKKSVFSTEIRIKPLRNTKFSNFKNDCVHSVHNAYDLSGSKTPSRVAKCAKCNSRKIYCTLSCNCNLCLEHFKEIGLSSNNKYVCEKHNTQIYNNSYSSKKTLPNLMINSTVVKKIN